MSVNAFVHGQSPEVNAIWTKLLRWKNEALNGGDPTPPRELFLALDRALRGEA